MNSTSIICPPFDQAKAIAKVQAAENAWNTRYLLLVSLAYSEDSPGATEINLYEDVMRSFDS